MGSKRYDFPSGVIVRVVGGVSYKYPNADNVYYVTNNLRVRNSKNVLAVYERENLIGCEGIDSDSEQVDLNSNL